MTAQEQMRRMLDELMGTGRNGEDVREKVHFSSHRVCKSFLLNCCPHDILAATRCDLGQCPKVHDFALRADYEAGAKIREYNFHTEALEQLKTFIAESERRTQVAKRRLAETQEVLTADESERLNKIHVLVTEIGESLAKAEQLGAEGKVEESLKLMESIEKLRREKMMAEQEYRNSVPASISQQQKLRVCEVCSSFLGLQDNDRRLADHFNGKLHLGFIVIREKIIELEKTIQEKHINKILEDEFGIANEKPVSRSTSPSPKCDKEEHYRKESHSSSYRSSHSHKHKHRSRSPVTEEHKYRHKSDRRMHYSHKRSSHRSSSRDNERAKISNKTEKERSHSVSSTKSHSDGRVSDS